MKNIFPKVLLVLLFGGSMGCSNLLEEEALTFFSEENIFSTEEGVETAVNGVYAQLSSGQYYGTSWHNLMMPLSGKFYTSQAINRDANGLNLNPNNRWVNDLWAQMYRTINSANIVIKNLESSNLGLSNQDRALGEAYFLRGYVYADMARLFGGVPLRTEPTEIDAIHLERTSRQQIIDLVISDLEKAKTMLPNKSEADLGRPARWAANVALAKLYMYLAGEDGGDTSYWQRAKEELLPVVESGDYQLTPTYAELFVPGNENTAESVFELQFGHTGGTRNSDIIRSFTPSNSIYAPSNTVTFGRIRPNKEVFDQHVEQYPDDPRIAATFLFDTYERVNQNPQRIYPANKKGNNGFAVIAKYFDPSYNGITTARNLILLRYADVLLMMAEIENEISGPDAAYQYVNQVLARARDTDGDGMSDAEQPADWAEMTQEQFRTRIFRERFYELLAEGHEWIDTRRRGHATFLREVVEIHNAGPNLDLTKEFIYPTSEKNRLLPIPLNELSGNQMVTGADQNPGY